MEGLSPREEVCVGTVWGNKRESSGMSSSFIPFTGFKQRVIKDLLFGVDPIVFSGHKLGLTKYIPLGMHRCASFPLCSSS